MFPKSSYLSSSLRYKYPVRLLIHLRWIALIGQVLAILISTIGFGDELPYFQVIGILSISIAVNLALTIFTGPRRRIPTDQVFYYLIYDIGQLGALLYVTGGLNNPFVILLLAPVVISSGFLSHRKNILVCFFALFMVNLLVFSPYPLPWEISGVFLPDRLRGGILVALVIGILFISFYTNRIAAETNSLSQALQATERALSQEQRLASLGALAAAAAHELGSPLTTMTIIAKDLQTDTRLPQDLHEDTCTLVEQTYRCRDILSNLALNFSGEYLTPNQQLPLSAAIEAIIHPHITKERTLEIDIQFEVNKNNHPEPTLTLRPEIIHGLGNIIQNGLQFATKKLLILLNWTSEMVMITIKDDGPGYPEIILNRLGDPYISGRSLHKNTESESEIHLGLGLFIAQTLLAKRGAKVYFENAGLETLHPLKNNIGASCKIIWPLSQTKDIQGIKNGNSSI